jgi:hypothetical protein
MSVIPLDQITQTPSQNQITQSLKLMAMWREDLAGWEPVAVLELAGRSWSSTAGLGASGLRAGRVGSGLPLPGSAVSGWGRAATEEQRRERRRNSVERGRGGERARTGGGERARTGGGERFVFFFSRFDSGTGRWHSL